MIFTSYRLLVSHNVIISPFEILVNLFLRYFLFFSLLYHLS
nr:MAG TPA: hypothetical protein [Caudoviricetes sp.]